MKLSIGGRLVARQLIFMVLVGSVGMIGSWLAWGVWTHAGELAAAGPGTAGLASLRDEARFLFYFSLGGTLTGVFLVIAVSMPMMHRAIAMPVRRLAARMSTLARGDVDADIPDLHRRDEIGAIAHSLLDLRDAVRRNAELVDENRQNDQRIAILNRNAQMLANVEEFSSGLSQTAARLQEMMRELTNSSQALHRSSDAAATSSGKARTSSKDAADDVNAVANASDQLQHSISEIDRQVSHASRIVEEAVSETRSSVHHIENLSGSAGRISDVVDSISRIAAQTNLLALNATIEAARAGEAGRGFAVVAQEVKALASQTAAATGDIARQIAEIQEAAQGSVAAMESISGKIVEVESISSIIAAAIHEQSLSTANIAQNVRSAATDMSTMVSSVDEVEAAMAETGESVARVVTLVDDLDALAAQLRERVKALGKALEAA